MTSKDFGIRDGEKAVELARQAGRRPLFHRPHPHARGRSARTARRTPANPRPFAWSSVDPRWHEGLKDVETCTHLVLLYWMDKSPRNLVLQVPGHYGVQHGTFALRSPARPNPVAMSVVKLLRVDGNRLSVVGLDCLDGTPLLDIKPYFASTDSVPDAVVGWHKAERLRIPQSNFRANRCHALSVFTSSPSGNL